METLENYLSTLKEDDHTELKTGERKIPSSFYETYSAFANTEGGTIYLGLKKGSPNLIVGLDNPEEQLKALLSTLSNKEKVSDNLLSPGDYEILEIGGKKIIKVIVREATRSEKPVYLNGSFSLAYKRLGEGDIRMQEDEIRSKLIDRDPNSKDLLVSPHGLSIEDLDPSSLAKYRERLLLYRPNDHLETLSDRELLTRIGAYRKDSDGHFGLTDAAILFFGKWQDIIGIYPGYFLDYQYYSSAGLERWTKRFSSDDLSWSGNILDFYLKIEETIPIYLPNPFKRDIDGATNLNGRDILEACLEIVVNALSNAAYILPMGVTFRQSPTFFEARNPGDILVGKQQALLGGYSIPRNPSILSFFRLIGVAEKSGLGIPKIYRVASRYGFPEPSLTVRKDLESTTLRASFLLLNENTPSKEVKMKIISYLLEHGESEAATIAGELGLSTSQAALQVKELILMGIVITNSKKTKGRKISLSPDYR